MNARSYLSKKKRHERSPLLPGQGVQNPLRFSTPGSERSTASIWSDCEEDGIECGDGGERRTHAIVEAPGPLGGQRLPDGIGAAGVIGAAGREAAWAGSVASP